MTMAPYDPGLVARAVSPNGPNVRVRPFSEDDAIASARTYLASVAERVIGCQGNAP